MKNKAQRILEYVQGEEEIGWVASDNLDFPFILNVNSKDTGIPCIRVFDKNMKFLGKIAIPKYSPNSRDNIKVLSGKFSDEDKDNLVNILTSIVDGEERWDLASIVWAAFHGEI